MMGGGGQGDPVRRRSFLSATFEAEWTSLAAMWQADERAVNACYCTLALKRMVKLGWVVDVAADIVPVGMIRMPRTLASNAPTGV